MVNYFENSMLFFLALTFLILTLIRVSVILVLVAMLFYGSRVFYITH
jgi:hypothetical protein